MPNIPPNSTPNHEQKINAQAPYGALRLHTGFASFVPKLSEPKDSSITTSTRWGRVLILKSNVGRYVQLYERDEFLISLMDGEKSVEEILLEYFHTYASLGIERMKNLLEKLQNAGLLVDSPAHAFEALTEKIRARSTTGKLARLAKMFFDFRVEINGLDKIVTFLYKYLVWILFTRAALFLYSALAVVGVGAFARVLAERRYPLSALYTSTDGSVGYGAVMLLAMTALMVFVHQAAHVFMAKAYKREVPCGGFTISYGLPFFYATTTDIWLEPKRRRIMVSMAGTISDLLLGSLGAIFLVLYPDHAMGSVIFKLSAVSFAALIMDLNPLMELDGYYALADYLEMPDLRSKAQSFALHKLPKKLLKRESFSRDERIYSIYGTLALLWTGVIVLAALFVLVSQMQSAISDLFGGESVIMMVMSLAVMLFFVLPVTVAIIAILVLSVWKFVAWVRSHPTFRDVHRLVHLILGVAITSGLLVVIFPQFTEEVIELAPSSINDVNKELLMPMWSLIYPAIAPGLLIATLVLAISASRQIQGARLSRSIKVFCIYLIVDTLRSIGISLCTSFGLSLELTKSLTHKIDLISWGAILVWGFYHLFITEFRVMSLLRRALVVLFVVITLRFILSSAYDANISSWVFAKVTLVATAITLIVAAFFSTLLNYSRTLLWWGWALLFAGLAFRILSRLGRMAVLGSSSYLKFELFDVSLRSDLLGATLLLFGFLMLRVILGLLAIKAQLRTSSRGLPPGDRARLIGSLSFLLQSLLNNIAHTFGRQSAKAIEKEFNYSAQNENRLLSIQKGVLITSEIETKDILTISREGRVALVSVEAIASKLAGTLFFRRLVTSVYDELYWNEREPVYTHFLHGLLWAENIKTLPRPENPDLQSLIEQISIFVSLNAESQHALVSKFKPRHIKAGERIVKENDSADSFFIVASGRLEVYHENAPDVVLAALNNGDYFGESAGTYNSRRNASVRATVDSELYELGEVDFRDFVTENISIAQKVAELGDLLDLLRLTPIFSKMPLAQLTVIAGLMERVEVPAGELVVKQGVLGKEFYIIMEGELSVIRDDGGGENTIALLSRGEYFGEIALIESVPRTASVRAITKSILLRLEKNEFEKRIGRSTSARRTLDNLASRRRRELGELHTAIITRPKENKKEG